MIEKVTKRLATRLGITSSVVSSSIPRSRSASSVITFSANVYPAASVPHLFYEIWKVEQTPFPWGVATAAEEILNDLLACLTGFTLQLTDLLIPQEPLLELPGLGISVISQSLGGVLINRAKLGIVWGLNRA